MRIKKRNIEINIICIHQYICILYKIQFINLLRDIFLYYKIYIMRKKNIYFFSFYYFIISVIYRCFLTKVTQTVIIIIIA